METDECLNNNGGCWRDEKTNVTACKVVLWPPPPKFLGVHNTSTLPACLLTDCVLEWKQDTYRGRICQCPVVDGVQYQGDGYTDCKGIIGSMGIGHTHFILPLNIFDLSSVASSAVGLGRCAMDNGGCWKETRQGKTFSACSVILLRIVFPVLPPLA